MTSRNHSQGIRFLSHVATDESKIPAKNPTENPTRFAKTQPKSTKLSSDNNKRFTNFFFSLQCILVHIFPHVRSSKFWIFGAIPVRSGIGIACEYTISTMVTGSCGSIYQVHCLEYICNLISK